MARLSVARGGVTPSRGQKASPGDLPPSALTGSSHYDLGKDAFDNMAIGSALASLQPGVTGTNQVQGCQRNVAIGSTAGASFTTDTNEVAIGWAAMNAMVNGTGNVAIGTASMQNATGGSGNIAVGANTLKSVQGGIYPATINGTFNVAIGDSTGPFVTTGFSNTLLGGAAGHLLTTADHCVFVGESAGAGNVSNNRITIVGADSLNNGPLGAFSNIVVVGDNCLQSASFAGSDVTAVGHGALTAAQAASQNTAVGSVSGRILTTAASCTLLGYASGFNLLTGGLNTLVGANAGQALSAGAQNTIVGAGAGNVSSTDSTKMTLVGQGAVGGASFVTALGAGASATATGAVAIGVDSGGTGASTSTANEIKLGTANHTVNVPTTSAIGNGASGNLTALAKGTGGGPASDAVNAWIPMRNGATSGWIPFFV